MAQLIITAVGPDRPGIVGELTGHLHAGGANLLDSRMVNLRGQFAIVLLIEISEDAAARRTIAGFGKQIGLTLSVTPEPATQNRRRFVLPAQDLFQRSAGHRRATLTTCFARIA